METLERIVDDFNLVFGDIEWGDPDTVRQQIRQVVTKLQENDEVRDSMLNNDEETQMQVIHDNISTELGIITANSSEMQRRYLSQPSIQAQLDNLILMRLQEQLESGNQRAAAFGKTARRVRGRLQRTTVESVSVRWRK